MGRHDRPGSSTARYPRTARVNEVLREVIATELERESDDDPRLEMVTVTGVHTDPDLRHATVYFSALSKVAEPEKVLDALSQRRIALQSAIAGSVRLKRTPQLQFSADPAISEGQKVEAILRTIHSSELPSRNKS